MKTIAYVFPLTALVVFFQAITGAALELGFYDFGAHEMSGYLVGIMALVSVAVAFGAKPKYNALRYASLTLLVLVVVQGTLGFAARTSDQLVVVHFVNALVLYGISIAITFYSFRWGRAQASLATPSHS